MQNTLNNNNLHANSVVFRKPTIFRICYIINLKLYKLE